VTVNLRIARAMLVILLPMSVVFGAQSAERVLLGAPPNTTVAGRADNQTVGELNRLRATAARAGTVRVIVGLRMLFAPQASLPPNEARAQRNDIAAARATVLARMPGLAARLDAVRAFETVPFLGLTVTADELERLARLNEISSIREDRLFLPFLGISVPHVGAAAAAAAGFSGAGQVVAVLDTGVANTHPFLAGKVVAEACYSATYEAGAYYSLCPGGAFSSTAPNSGLNCPAHIAGCAHGTHVAGIAAGNAGPADSPAGVARGANIIAVQVFTRFERSDVCGNDPVPCVRSFESHQIQGLERVLALTSAHKVAAVNMSLGGASFTSEAQCDNDNLAIKAAIDNLRAVGVATVIASGNNGFVDRVSAPACISTAVAVGATYARAGQNNACMNGYNLGTSFPDAVACFSNSAPFLDLLAPGGAIQSSVLGGAYAAGSGTSMAAPHVAGAWAVLKQKNPSATVDQVLSALTSTGVPVHDPRNQIVKRRIDVQAAIAALPAPAVPAIVPDIMPILNLLLLDQ
jgi:subtilisin family serine protease